MRRLKYIRKTLPFLVAVTLLSGSASAVPAASASESNTAQEKTAEIAEENESDRNEDIILNSDADTGKTKDADDSETEDICDPDTGYKDMSCENGEDVETGESSEEDPAHEDSSDAEDIVKNNSAAQNAGAEMHRLTVSADENILLVSLSDDKAELMEKGTTTADSELCEELLAQDELIVVTVEEQSTQILNSGDLAELSQSDTEENTEDPDSETEKTYDFSEGTVVYISAGAEDGYVLSSVQALEEDGTSIQINDAEKDTDLQNNDAKTDGLFSFIMPDQDVFLSVSSEVQPADSGENANTSIISVDYTDTEISALSAYLEEQGLLVEEDEVMLAAAASEVRTITFAMNGFVSYSGEGYGTGYDAVFTVHSANYQGNANAYCLNPALQAPGRDSQGQSISYTTTVTDYTDPMLLKILYYGFGGPGDITASYADTATGRHVLTHMVSVRRAAELNIPGAGDYTYRANADAIAKADALYNAINAQPAITGTVSVLTPVAGQQAIMLLANYQTVQVKGELKLSKTSANVSITDGNSCYSLKGAGYAIYSDASLKNLVQTFTTNEDGTSSVTHSLDPGTYYIKEVTAPEGYQLDPTVYQAKVSSGKTTTVRTSDVPESNPVDLLLEKVDAADGKASERLKGAQFTVYFYPTSDDAALSVPSCSWVFETDGQGEIHLDPSCKVSGDELYKDADGRYVLPLGIITIQETKAPEGYQLNDTVYTCKTQVIDGTVETADLPTGENAVQEEAKTTQLSVSKTVSGSGGNKNKEFHFILTLTSDNGSVIPDSLYCTIMEDAAETAQNASVLNIAGQNVTETSGADSGETSSDQSSENRTSFSYQFTLQHGETITFHDLPYGLSYAVVEEDGEEDGYTVTSQNAEGTIQEEPVHVSFTNNKELTVPTAANTNLLLMEILLITASVIIFGILMGWVLRTLLKKN